jgi:hypothetical protein
VGGEVEHDQDAGLGREGGKVVEGGGGVLGVGDAGAALEQAVADAAGVGPEEDVEAELDGGAEDDVEGVFLLGGEDGDRGVVGAEEGEEAVFVGGHRRESKRKT